MTRVVSVYRSNKHANKIFQSAKCQCIRNDGRRFSCNVKKNYAYKKTRKVYLSFTLRNYCFVIMSF